MHEKSLRISRRDLHIWLMRRSRCHPQAEKKRRNRFAPLVKLLIYERIHDIQSFRPAAGFAASVTRGMGDVLTLWKTWNPWLSLVTGGIRRCLFLPAGKLSAWYRKTYCGCRYSIGSRIICWPVQGLFLYKPVSISGQHTFAGMRQAPPVDYGGIRRCPFLSTTRLCSLVLKNLCGCDTLPIPR